MVFSANNNEKFRCPGLVELTSSGPYASAIAMCSPLKGWEISRTWDKRKDINSNSFMTRFVE